jgi:hypothetical protein
MGSFGLRHAQASKHLPYGFWTRFLEMRGSKNVVALGDFEYWVFAFRSPFDVSRWRTRASNFGLRSQTSFFVPKIKYPENCANYGRQHSFLVFHKSVRNAKQQTRSRGAQRQRNRVDGALMRANNLRI